jgi:hypothetical protein
VREIVADMLRSTPTFRADDIHQSVRNDEGWVGAVARGCVETAVDLTIARRLRCFRIARASA